MEDSVNHWHVYRCVINEIFFSFARDKLKHANFKYFFFRTLTNNKLLLRVS